MGRAARPAPSNEDEDYSKKIIRINLVEAKGGSARACERLTPIMQRILTLADADTKA